MTAVKAFWENQGKRREYELKELSADEFDAMQAAGNHHVVGMPIYWSHVITGRKPDPGNPPQVRIWPMSPSATITVDGVIADVPGDAVRPPLGGAERGDGR